MSIVISDPYLIERVKLIALKHALKLEMKGMKRFRPTCIDGAYRSKSSEPFHCWCVKKNKKVTWRRKDLVQCMKKVLEKDKEE